MPQSHGWVETLLSPGEFAAQLLDEDLWESGDGGATGALRDACDFLLLAAQSCPTVVMLQEGYHKLQPAALDRQLPPELRAEGGLRRLPAAQLMWTPSTNLLHPLQLWSRERSGHTPAYGPQPQQCMAHLEPVPFAVVERCKLLDVQYVRKELYPVSQQQQHSQDLPQLPEHEHVWGTGTEGLQQQQQQQPVCRRLSLRVLLQRLPAAPLPDEARDAQDNTQLQDSSSWQQRGLQGAGNTCSQAYTCMLEYPAFTLKSSDYIVQAEVFDRGIRSWAALRKGEPFWMKWDETEFRGFAAGFRQRKPGDPFLGSPWWSIAVEWEGHSTDRRNDPEDWCFGNPWEMRRESGNQRPPLPDAQTALAAISKAGHPVLAAPWTRVWADAMVHAEARSRAKRKRQEAQHDDDFVYFEDLPGQQGNDGLDEEAAAGAADLWDPSEFYYDDDPMDYELEADEELEEQQQRRGSRRQQQHTHSSRRNRHARQRVTSPADDTADQAPYGHKARKAAGSAAAAQGELTHTYGRELLARTGVCVVCGSSEGSLVSGHTGRSSGNCARQYHAGCMLLLNAAGMRAVCLAKRPTKAGSSSSRVGTAQQAAAAQALCDGLLGQLMQQSQQAEHGLSAATLQAIAAAQEAAAQVAQGHLALSCPSHSCHGCHLNGKLEFMVWCCCCWLRVYHHRQCVPYGAQQVQMDGKDFIRCPHCTAAGVPVPGSSAAGTRRSSAAGTRRSSAAPAAVPAAAAAAADADLGSPVACGLTAAAGATAAGVAGHGHGTPEQHAGGSWQAGREQPAAAQTQPDTATDGVASHSQHLQTLQEQLQLLRELLLAPTPTADTADAATAPQASPGVSSGVAGHAAGVAAAPVAAVGVDSAGQQQSRSALAAAVGPDDATAAAAGACDQDSTGQAPVVGTTSSALLPVELLDSSECNDDEACRDHGNCCQQQQQERKLHYEQQAQQNGKLQQQQQPLLNGKLHMGTSQQQQQCGSKPQLQQLQQLQGLQQHPDQQPLQQLAPPQAEQQQDHERPGRKQQQQQCGGSSSSSLNGAMAADVDPYAAEIAELEARLQVLRQQQQQWRQQQQQQQTAGQKRRRSQHTACKVAQHQHEAQEQQGLETAGAGASVRAASEAVPACPAAPAGVAGAADTPDEAPAAAARTGGAAGGSPAAGVTAGDASDAVQEPAAPQGPTMPSWLQLAIEDCERLQPSFQLVPCAADGSELSTATGAAGSSNAGESALVLAAAAAAAGMLPPAAQGAAAAGAPLLLRSPHSHWLIGSLSKAEAQYRPANTWGVAMIGVPQCPDDVVYGLAVVLDFLPALQQRQAQLALASQLPPALEAAAGGSSSSQGGLTAAGDTQPPGVFLRCNRAVARDGRLQLARGNDEGRKGEWQVLVNGRPYPERQGRNGLQLFAGDVITVQGLRFKLQLSRMVVQ